MMSRRVAHQHWVDFREREAAALQVERERPHVAEQILTPNLVS